MVEYQDLSVRAGPIYRSRIPRYTADRQNRLLEAVYERMGTDKGKQPVSVRNGRQSNDTLFQSDDPTLVELFNDAIHVASYVTGRDLMITSAWANILGNGGSHVEHDHGSADYVACCYLSVNASRLGHESLDAGKIRFINGEYKEVLITPMDGDIMVFGGKVRHSVYPNAGTTNRITVAMNFKVQ